MPDPTKPATPTPSAPFAFDEAKFQSMVVAQEEYLKQFVGKKDHNPFVQLQQISKMREEYHNGNRSEGLYKRAIGLKQEPPRFGPPAPKAALEAPKTDATK